MADSSGQTLIVKKTKKGGHGHHGGAWKVAYADFVTAMMAFFLLLWLLNAVTQEQLEGISNYFAPSSVSKSESGSGGMLSGQTMSKSGMLRNDSSAASVVMDLPPPQAGTGPKPEEEADTAEGGPSDVEQTEQSGGTSNTDQVTKKDLNKKDLAKAEEARRQREQEQFERAANELRQAIQSIPNMKELANSLLIDNTQEGLRIQLVDQERLSMFPRGSDELYLRTRKLLELVAAVVQKMPQDITITGHTDSTKFVAGDRTGYTNWELSSDRAAASRRALIDYGVPADRIVRIIGAAAEDPLLPKDPENPRNRRISIILLRGTGQQPLEPAAAEPGPTPPDATKADTATPDASKTDAAKPDTPKTDSSEVPKSPN